MEEFIHFNLFYLFLFVFLIITVITICSVIKSRNGNMTFKDMFCKSSDNARKVAIDTTDKMKSMHDNVIHVEFSEKHEKEFDALERSVKELQDNVKELKNIVNLLIEKVIKLENNHK